MRSVCTSFSRSGGPVNQGLAASRGHAVVAVGPAHGHAPIRMGRALSGATAGMRSKAEERNHRGVQPLRALDLSAVPQEAIIAGGAVAGNAQLAATARGLSSYPSPLWVGGG
eukprot:366546-Chlamydomonas_euryale.AAC.2